MIKIRITVLLGLCRVFLTQCYSIKWNNLHDNNDEDQNAPIEVVAIFNNYPDNIMTLNALSPAYGYDYDIGEKDSLYGKYNLALRFRSVEIRLAEKMPAGKILVNLSFIDGENNRIEIKNMDLLRLVPKLEGSNELAHAELLLKEFNRFGYVFRREHKEFELISSSNPTEQLNPIFDAIYRCKVTNNCLSAGKWELEVTSEDYSDFRTRIRASNNLNQNKIIAHSWFYLDSAFYETLLRIKNPNKNFNVNLSYNSLSDLAEQVVVNFDELRNPLKHRLNTTTLEVGHQTSKKIEPLDVEQFYKKQFGLILEANEHTYSSILESPIKVTQFRNEGFYYETSPKEFDFSWMKYMDDVIVDVIDVEETDAYVQITLTGKDSPYNITLGNIDLAQLDEQKLLGFLFGINTYPKGRRYNPVQTTISYDPDLLPNDIKPYLLLTGNKSHKWVNTQYKGIEKVYITYETLERDVLNIYVLSYERILSVWMARVLLPRDFREIIRIRRNLYNY